MCSCVRTTDMLPHFQDTCTQKHDINHGRENKIMKKRRMNGETVARSMAGAETYAVDIVCLRKSLK